MVVATALENLNKRLQTKIGGRQKRHKRGVVDTGCQTEAVAAENAAPSSFKQEMGGGVNRGQVSSEACIVHY